MPVPTDQTLGSLRELYDKTSSTIARFSFVRAVIIAIGAFTFASALDKISSSEVKQIVEKLQKTYDITGTVPDFNDMFLSSIYPPSLFVKSSSTSEAAPSGAMEPTDTTGSEAAGKEETQDVTAAGTAASEGKGEVREGEKNNASQTQEELIAPLTKTYDITGTFPDFNDVFLSSIYPPSLFNKGSAAPEAAPSGATESTDRAGSETAGKEEATQHATAVGTAASGGKGEVTAEEKNKALQTQGELVAQLTKIADDSFTLAFKAPLMGTDIRVDLRIWGFLLIPFAILAEVYLCLLRFKRKTIYTLASLVVKRDRSNTTVADQLQFPQRNNSAFIRHPAQYEIAMSLIGAVALAIYVAQAGATFWQTWDTDAQVMLINAYAFVAIYAVAYVAYARRQLNKPVLIAQGLNAPVGRFFRTTRASVRSIVRRIPPRPNLGTAGLMILSTLWLLVGAPGCDKPQTGLEFIKEPKNWFGWGGGHQIIRGLYLVGLLLAALSCCLVLYSIFSSKLLQSRRLTFILGDVGVVLSLFFITNLTPFIIPLSFINLLQWSGTYSTTQGTIVWAWKFADLGELGRSLFALFLTVGLCVLPIWAWLRYRHRGYKNRRTKWPAKQRWLLRWYYPQVAYAAFSTFIMLFNPPRLIGVPVFILGIAILAATYTTIANRESAIAHRFPKSSRKRKASVQISRGMEVEDRYQPTTVRTGRFTGISSR